ncbi:UDP-N-acetylglucosamine 2-epimerase (non-hydrolyzing), partial [bacterium]|nr:UDP-N-acetylglucosamine 2-epimerase (non-hydrolyzing) [bacterium]
MKISIIIGTRPEIIKMSPIIRCLKKEHINFFIIHTGQHYSFKLDEIFFKDLKLPIPEYNLNIGSGTHGEETGEMLIKIERVLMKEKPDIVLVEGDTNTVVAGALAAAKLGIKVGHVEAGLRSYDRQMPEEINRIITDHISDYLFAPTEKAKKNLIYEGILNNKIFCTGNTIVDAIYQNLGLIQEKTVLMNLQLKKNEYFLLTLHRQENVDNKVKLSSIIKALKNISNKFD